MSQLLRSLLLLTVSLFLGGCGGGSMPAPTPVGIFVQSTPANQTAYAAMAPPQNQVSFAAFITYSDGSVGSTPISGVQWANSDLWVSLSRNVATCTQPAPVLILGTVFSTVTATAQVSGKTYSDSSGLYCL